MIRDSVNEIEQTINEFVDGLPEIEKRQYDKVYSLLKDLSLDSKGNIKPTIANLKVINKVKRELSSLVNNPIYQDKVIDISKALEKVNVIQTSYYSKTFKGFAKPNVMPQIQALSYDNVVRDLTEVGINEFVIGDAVDIVEGKIRSGGSFHTMVNELRVKMLGDSKVPSKLQSYAKQIINDAMSGYARNYHAIVTSDLDLEWFQYVGSLVASSRPMCIVLVAKRWIHKSELAGIARGEVDGVKVSTEGFFKDTTGENFPYRCAGFNCEHQLIPVPSVVVPKELRDKFEKIEA